MFRGGVVCLVVVAVVVVGGSPSLASSTPPFNLTHDELLMSVIVNQMAILRGMNESTFIASNENKLNQLRQEIQEGRDFMSDKMEEIGDAITERTLLLDHELNEKMHEMEEKVASLTQKMTARLESTRISATSPRIDSSVLYADHNDSYHSPCEGHKVLFGGDGALLVANYSHNTDCSWEVTLPEGTRPVFRWHYYNIEKCTLSCNCDYVYVMDADHSSFYKTCGDTPPDGSFLTVINNKFKVVFHSDSSVSREGFLLQYRSVINN